MWKTYIWTIIFGQLESSTKKGWCQRNFLSLACFTKISYGQISFFYNFWHISFWRLQIHTILLLVKLKVIRVKHQMVYHFRKYCWHHASHLKAGTDTSETGWIGSLTKFMEYFVSEMESHFNIFGNSLGGQYFKKHFSWQVQICTLTGAFGQA